MQTSLNNIADAVVVVVEPTASVRMMITEVLRNLGFARPYGVSTGREALDILEVEAVHWLIMPLMANEEINALQILKLITEMPDLKETATTLLLEPSSEDYCLPLAFEMGLLSWQPKSYVKDHLQGHFQELLKTLSTHEGNLTLTAAEYLRRFLTEKKMHKSRAALEQNLMASYPGSPKILIHMAEAEIFAGNTARAWGLLSQAEVIDEKLSPVCKHLRDKYSKNGEAEASTNRENTLGIKNVMIVDPDSDVLYAVSEMLNHLGVNFVQTFENGQDAFDWLTKTDQEPDLILMEWRIPGLSGPILIQRLRQAGFFHVPVIVTSSLIKKEEKPLLMEMGVDEILEKPFDRTSFYSIVVWAIQQNKTPTEQKSLERKFRRLLEMKKQGEAERLLAQLIADSRITEGAKKGVQAEYALALGDYEMTCKLGVEALRLGGDSLSLLSLIGKALLKLGQYEKALKCFEKANSLCSINIERLLTIAEINVHLDRMPASEKVMNEVSALDPANPMALETRCKIDIESGNLDAAKKGLDALESVPRIASYINNRAVALARSGRYEDSIKLYKKAIHCLENKWEDLSFSVTYNLGLAHARYGDYETAVKTLEDLSRRSQTPVHKKAKALLKRIDLSIKSGDRLFQEADVPVESFDPPSTESGKGKFSAKLLEDLMVKLSAKRGDIGCYLLFHIIESMASNAQALLASMPPFNKRRSIDKEVVAVR